ncbi:MAG TPA: TIGR03619 family F420-dependent LLM class oxidoreductase [Sphingobium sp.]
MKFSMAIPVGDTTPGEFQTLDAVREMAGALEKAGLDACYVTDHPAPSAEWLHTGGLGHDALDPFAALAFVASVSSTLLLQTNIVVLPYRNPFITAKAAATVQVLSGGRLIMGTAPGYQKGEFEALGVDFHKRGAIMDEALDTIRLAWAGGAVVKEGRSFHAKGNEPRPAPNPAPPIWIGGGSDKAVERAARAGDGWCPFFADPRMSKVNQDAAVQSIEHLGERLKQIAEMRDQFGRSGSFEVQLSPLQKLAFGRSDQVQQYVDAIGALADAGVHWAAVEPPHPSRAAYIEHVHWFGEEVIAKLRG